MAGVQPFAVPTVTVPDLPAQALILDVREDHEWVAGHIAGAVHVPMGQLPSRLADEPGGLRPDTACVVVCRVGSRSARVTAWLVQRGYDAVNLDGGMHAWAAAGRPMTSEDGQPPRVA
jgi:rhodanese-related sulfurtransferase